MKALVLEEYKKLVVKEVDKPEIAKNEVLIRVKAVSICGSDVHGYDGTSGRRLPPVIMGHEASGIIEEKGSEVSGYDIGDRVVFNSAFYCGHCIFCLQGKQNLCVGYKVFGVSTEDFNLPGAMAEFVKVPAHLLFHLPDNIPFDQAALIEPMSIALHAINRVRLNLNDTAVIFGSGTIGMMVLKLLALSSVGKIIIVDIDDEKLESAKQNGADFIVNSAKSNVKQAISEITGNKGADVVFEAVGIPPTLSGAVECLRKGGTVVLLGNLSKTVEMPMQQVVVRELNIKGSNLCTTEYNDSISLLETGNIRVDDMISHTCALEDGPAMFDRLHTSPAGMKKVVMLL